MLNGQLPQDITIKCLSYLTDIDDLKSSRLVCKSYKQAIDQVAKSILLSITLKSQSELAFKRIIALEHLINQMRIEKPINYSHFTTNCLCCTRQATNLFQRNILAKLFELKMPTFNNFLNFTQIISHPSFKDFFRYYMCSTTPLNEIISVIFPTHSACKDLQIIVLNHTKNFESAIKENNLESVDYLLEEERKNSFIDPQSLLKGLEKASEEGNLELFEKLLAYTQEKSIQVDFSNLRKLIIQSGNLNFIVKHSPLSNLDEETINHPYTLLGAAKGGLKTFEYFWPHISDQNLNRYTSLSGGLAHMAAANNQTVLLKHLYLLDSHILLNCNHKYQHQPIHEASRKGCYEALQFLLEYGAKVNDQTLEGFTPLMMAAQGGHIQVVELLIQNGADLSIVTMNHYSALTAAIRFSQQNPELNTHSLKLIQLILKHSPTFLKAKTLSMANDLGLHTKIKWMIYCSLFSSIFELI